MKATLHCMSKKEISLSQDLRRKEKAERREGQQQKTRPPNLITPSFKALPSGEKRATLLIKRTYFKRHSGKGKASWFNLAHCV